MGTRCALAIKDKTNVLYMNTMNDGFPKEFVPNMKNMFQDWEDFLNKIKEKLNSGAVKSPLMSRWVPEMLKLIDDFKLTPTVEVAGLFCSQLNFHLFRFIPWVDNPKLDNTYPIQKKLGEVVYNIRRETVIKKRNPVQMPAPEPLAIASDRKILRVKYKSTSDYDTGTNFICDVSVPFDMTQEQLDRYIQEINSLEAQMLYFASSSEDVPEFIEDRYSKRTYELSFKTSDMVKEMFEIQDLDESRLVDLLRSSGTGYYDVSSDYFARALCWVSAGKILPLNEANALWARTQLDDDVAFLIHQYIRDDKVLRVMMTEYPVNDLNERIAVFNEFNEFVKSISPDKKIYREYFILQKGESGVMFPLTIDMIRYFEFFASFPHQVPEPMVEFEKDLPLLYSFKE